MISTNLPIQKNIDQEWSAEVERRCQALDRGESKFLSGNEVFEKIRKRFSK